MRFVIFSFLLFVVAGCAGHAPRQGDILVIGDSIMAWNGDSNQDIANVIAHGLEREVSARPVPGARFVNGSRIASAVGFDIRAQYPGGDWNWIVLNGGANDLVADDCACGDCAAAVTRLIDAEATGGAIPVFLDRLVASGARILWMGYYTTPGDSFAGCADDLAAMEARIVTYAARHPGVYFFDGKTVIDPADLSLFISDKTHPTPKASALLGTALTDVIRAHEDRSQNP